MITKPKIHIDLKQVESLAANGLTQEQIAAALGISETT
jgi:DNA-binding CsgD family transcriptional regulator